MKSQADTIIYNGLIYKSDSEKTWAEAAAIGGGRFLCVGALEECQAFQGDETAMVDAEGSLILPGLIDGHTHPETIAKSRWRVQLPEFENKDQLLSFVRDYCQKHPVEELPYFFGEAYPSTMFDSDGPKKEWLDAYVSDRPVRLQDFTDHACWYNSKALELMGIDKTTEETGSAPFFIRDEANEPTGWVLEPLPGSACEEPLFEKISWHPPTQVTEETIMPFLEFLGIAA